MSQELMIKQFDGSNIFFMEDGWFNATSAAKHYNKNVIEWLRSDESFGYSVALAKSLKLLNHDLEPGLEMIQNCDNQTVRRNLIPKFLEDLELIRTKRGSPENGGGTWFHPKLGVVFARWLSFEFAVWCDSQIELIIKSGISDSIRDPFPVLVHPVYGFPIVSMLEDHIHKTVRNTYIETLNRLGFNAPIYKQTLTNNVSRILIGMPIKPFRRLFGIPAGSRVRTRLFMDSNLRRATSEIEETSCFMVNRDRSIVSFEQVEYVVYQVAQMIYQRSLSRGLTLVENVPEELLLS